MPDTVGRHVRLRFKNYARHVRLQATLFELCLIRRLTRQGTGRFFMYFASPRKQNMQVSKRSNGKSSPSSRIPLPLMQKCCLVLIPPGFEEIEVVTPLDVLRRGKITVTLAAVGAKNLLLQGKHQLRLQADCHLDEALQQPFDGLILPGGPGVQTLLESQAVLSLARSFDQEGKVLAAICGAPLVLYKAGLLEGRKYTAHFSVAHTLTHIHLGNPVIVDKNLITANGPGAALPFGLELLKALSSEEMAQEVAKSMCYMAF